MRSFLVMSLCSTLPICADDPFMCVVRADIFITDALSMATLDDSAQQGRHFVSDSETASMKRAMPIIQSSTTSSNSPSPEDPMDVASPAPNMTMGPPARNSPDGEANGNRDQSGVLGEHGNTSGPSAAAAAQAGAQAPKVVQTAFIDHLMW